jgi:hypothetical protein
MANQERNRKLAKDDLSTTTKYDERVNGQLKAEKIL